MYNLYRAWFGEESYPHIETLSPPDTVVRVGNEGEHQFVAHRRVLAAHSGYLKALLTSTSTVAGSSRDESSSVTSVSVSSVGGEAFAPLLNYMYTGRLDVTLDNIYSVLLATHLLHMPGALEQCRSALLRLRGPPPPPPPLISNTSTPRSTILRPVPNRFIGTPLCWPQNELYPSAPIGMSHLTNLHLPSSLPLLPTPNIINETATSTNYRKNPAVSPPLPLYQPQTAKISQTKLSTPPQNSPKATTSHYFSEQFKKIDQEQHSKSRASPNSSSSEKISITNLESPSPRNSDKGPILNNDRNSTSSNSGVVLDIACCDGPIKFHRVLNGNYTAPTNGLPHQIREKPCSSTEDPEILMENDENGRPDDKSEIDEPVESSSGSSGSFRCSYCQHTFKSHYCYKKHARRHLLPTDNESNARADVKHREVRQLDLNVQYYPCKICGSKFPSYYFVHKHKKLCHASADERNSEEESSQQILQVASCSKA